jgi:hypothetical protein
MADRSSDEDLAQLVSELVGALRDIEREIDPPDRRRPPLPTPDELRQFTSEVAIPGLILMLETNIRALRLLQRALELGDRADQASESAEEVRERAASLSATTLDRLDDVLVELQSSMDGRPNSDVAAALLEDARELRQEVRSRLAESATQEDGQGEGFTEDSDGGGGLADDADGDGGVPVDVDAELQSIKDELDENEASGAESSSSGRTEGGDGATGGGEESGDDSTGDEAEDGDGSSNDGGYSDDQ